MTEHEHNTNLFSIPIFRRDRGQIPVNLHKCLKPRKIKVFLTFKKSAKNFVRKSRLIIPRVIFYVFFHKVKKRKKQRIYGRAGQGLSMPRVNNVTGYLEGYLGDNWGIIKKKRLIIPSGIVQIVILT